MRRLASNNGLLDDYYDDYDDDNNDDDIDISVAEATGQLILILEKCFEGFVGEW